MTLARRNHIIRDHFGISTIHCKVCGTIIRQMVPTELPIQVKKESEITHIHHRMTLGINANYRELTLIVQDDEGNQNFHVTHCCTSCRERAISDLSLAEEMYQADLDDFETGEALQQRLVDAWRKLHVIGVKS